MATPTFSQYITEISRPYQRIQDTKNSLTTVAGRMYSSWILAPQAGLIPSTSAATDRNTIGGLGQQNATGTQFFAQVVTNCAQNGTVILIDRLAHQGGLSGIVSISAQTTNLPTTALTRYTGSYVGVMAAVEIYTAVGATAAFISGSYTNQAGQAGRTFVTTSFGATGFNAVSRFIILPLQQGDTGVRSVQSVVLSTSTATAGNFGVTLFKPIAVWSMQQLNGQQQLFDAIMSNGMQLEQIQNNACLHYLYVMSGISTGVYMSGLRFIEV
jgi:hypothetical protein